MYVGGCEDKSELALAVKDVISCLSSRAIKPSPLKSAIKLLELQKLHSTLSYESITSLADSKNSILLLQCEHLKSVMIRECLYNELGPYKTFPNTEVSAFQGCRIESVLKFPEYKGVHISGY